MSRPDNNYDYKALVEGQNTSIVIQLRWIGGDFIWVRIFPQARVFVEEDEHDPNDDNE